MIREEKCSKFCWSRSVVLFGTFLLPENEVGTTSANCSLIYIVRGRLIAQKGGIPLSMDDNTIAGKIVAFLFGDSMNLDNWLGITLTEISGSDFRSTSNIYHQN